MATLVPTRPLALALAAGLGLPHLLDQIVVNVPIILVIAVSQILLKHTVNAVRCNACWKMLKQNLIAKKFRHE